MDTQFDADNTLIASCSVNTIAGGSMNLQQAIMEIGKSIPGQFEVQRDGSAKLEAVIAERKAFLSKKN